MYAIRATAPFRAPGLPRPRRGRRPRPAGSTGASRPGRACRAPGRRWPGARGSRWGSQHGVHLVAGAEVAMSLKRASGEDAVQLADEVERVAGDIAERGDGEPVGQVAQVRQVAHLRDAARADHPNSDAAVQRLRAQRRHPFYHHGRRPPGCVVARAARGRVRFGSRPRPALPLTQPSQCRSACHALSNHRQSASTASPNHPLHDSLD